MKRRTSLLSVNSAIAAEILHSPHFFQTSTLFFRSAAFVLQQFGGAQFGGAHWLAATVGLLLLLAVANVGAAVRYVKVSNFNPIPPYSTWATAARTIQDAVDVALAGDEIVVTNGTYRAGGRAFNLVTNRLLVNVPVTIRSVNGPEMTVIDGGRTMRCVYLDVGASLAGFTLTNGVADFGGGVRCISAAVVVSNSVLTGNLATYGGGACDGTLKNCTLTHNSAAYGGGAYACTLNNCILAANAAINNGGGAYQATLNNCTLTGNLAHDGGGAYAGTLHNCIVYYNKAGFSGANYNGSVLSYCCTTPLPSMGTGNRSSEPQLASASHLSAGSPCRGAGNALFSSGVDVDGEPWASSPSIGCDEYRTGAVTGPLSVAIETSSTNVGTGFEFDFQALINGRASASAWDFGDGTTVSNRPYTPHGWTTAGDYAVVLWAYNDSYPGGVNATVTVHVTPPPVHHVAVQSSNPSAPYDSWATAARNIQDAVDAATVSGALVLVNNGVYQTGGRKVSGTLINRVAVTKALTVQSVNGPEVTVIKGNTVPGTTTGDAAVRCVYLGSGAALVGFTLTNGATRGFAASSEEQLGGGVMCASASEVVSNCLLIGNAAASSGGGAYYGRLENCILTGNSAYSGGAAYFGILTNCLLTNNSATEGGAASGCTLDNCTLTANRAGQGGAVAGSILYNCTLVRNSGNRGAGASGGELSNCDLIDNSATEGGGAYYTTLNNCTLTGNSAQLGGGASGGMLSNCVLAANVALNNGGAAYQATLNNCTLTGNSAQDGGGAFGAALNNCIVYYNKARFGEANYNGSVLFYCCTTPMPSWGLGNLSAEPQLASASHLSAGSPCRGAGGALFNSGVDIDGEPWANPPSIGCDEYYVGAVTGPLSVEIEVSSTNVVTGFAVDFQAQIGGRASASAWDFGDGTVVSNRPYASHRWTAAGDYAVLLWTYNDSYPGGVNATVTVHVMPPLVHYVATGSSNPLAPYDSWATAARNIQDAVDAATVSGAVVLVSNGVYQTGERVAYGSLSNRVAVTKPVTVQSVNGPKVTVIEGHPVPSDGAVRCVYLTNGAALIGFTLTNGATRAAGDIDREQSGGGVWCESSSELVSNCLISGNTASSNGGGAVGGKLMNCTLAGNSAHYGGGVYKGRLDNCALIGNSGFDLGGGANYSTLNNCSLKGNWANYGGGAYYCNLNNCILTGNSAASSGGGANYSTLNNCTLTGNSAQVGGGGYDGTMNNCILYYNSAGFGGANYDGSTLNYSSTTPFPFSGEGNFTNAPMFVSLAGCSFRLQSNSPCINAGLNSSAPGDTDFDGNPRIVGGTVDVGAYEFQSPRSLISYAWLQQYGLAIGPTSDSADPDDDGFKNYDEWRAGTNPTNAQSLLRLLIPKPNGNNVVVSWESVPGRSYCLEWSTNLLGQPAFERLAGQFPATASTTAFTHTNAASLAPLYYRVGVK